MLSAEFFQNQLFRKNLSGTLSESNSLDLDQDRHFVDHDLGLNCLQRFDQQTTKFVASEKELTGSEVLQYSSLLTFFDQDKNIMGFGNFLIQKLRTTRVSGH